MTKIETSLCNQDQSEIQVTVLENINGEKRTFSLIKGESVLSMLKIQEGISFSHCAGHGVCGKCVVKFLKGVPLPMPADRRRFTPEQLRQGFRLACMAKPLTDCEIICEFPSENMKAITGYDLQGLKDQVRPAKNQSGEKILAKDAAQAFVAIDLGTTTIVMQLVERKTGRILDTYTVMNPQRALGTDVISRMEASIRGECSLLQEKVNQALENGINRWILEGYDIKLANLAGNTVMIQLLLGKNVEKLAAYPFCPETILEEKIEICGITTVILPGISAFVGGDILAGILWCEETAPKNLNTLLVDLGTNGEMVLCANGKRYATATAAGPAFEGGASAGVYGADLVKGVYQLRQEGILDETGLLKEPYFTEGIQVEGITLKQKDIRDLQMAKAAVYAGIQILLETAKIGLEDIDVIYLAGGFGYFLDVQAACEIGLLPSRMKEKTIAVGNTSLAGAILYALGQLEEERDRLKKRAEEITRDIVTINLAQVDTFESYYISAMSLAARNPDSKDVANN